MNIVKIQGNGTCRSAVELPLSYIPMEYGNK